MCRYLFAEQIIGNMFIELLKKDIKEISFRLLGDFEKKYDMFLRSEIDTIICMSAMEIYSAVEKYNKIFCIIDDKIVLNEIKDKDKIRDNNEITSLLEDYFKAGLPEDISCSVGKSVMAMVGTV